MIGEMILGHLTGDYLCQTSWMSNNKAKNTVEGWIAAIIHCLVYSCAVCLFMMNFDMLWFFIVFLSHFPIDKFSLGEWYMKKFKGISLGDYINADKTNEIDRSVIVSGSFTSFIYILTDNSLHLIIMYLSYILIY